MKERGYSDIIPLMGKKKTAIIGSENEQELKDKKTVAREQKKMRMGKKPTPTEVTEVTSDTVTETVAAPKKTKAAHARSKRYMAMKKLVPVEIGHSISDGIDLVRKTSLAKFGGSMELHITLKDKNWSKEAELPYPMPTKAKRIVAATDEVIAQIEAGKMDFDVLVTTPAMMGKLVKFAKVLGPRGLMPNPKNGTVSDNVEAAIKKLQSDKSVKLKTEKDGPAVHTVVGKLSMTDKQLEENVAAIMAVMPAGKIAKVILKSTMSPAVKLSI